MKTYRTQEAADILNVSAWFIRKECKAGKMPYHQTGTKMVFFTDGDIEEYLRRTAENTNSESRAIKFAENIGQTFSNRQGAEKACLSCYLRGAKVGNGINENMFTDERNRGIFRVVASRFAYPDAPIKDVLTFPQKHRGGNYSDRYVCQLLAFCSICENVEFYENSLMELAQKYGGETI